MKARMVQPKELTTKTLRPSDYLKGKAVKKVTKKTTKKVVKKDVAEKIPRYVDPDGGYLGIDERNLSVGWYFPDEGEFGLMLENKSYKGGDSGECAAAAEAIRAYLKSNKRELPLQGEEFQFDSIREARAVISVVNAALHYWKKEQPLPEWAQKALAMGWLPPKGWKP